MKSVILEAIGFHWGLISSLYVVIELVEMTLHAACDGQSSTATHDRLNYHSLNFLDIPHAYHSYKQGRQCNGKDEKGTYGERQKDEEMG